MIKLIQMDGEEIVINAELIETVRATPDTVISLTNKKKLLVQEDVDEVIEKVISYRKKTLSFLKELEG